MSYKNRSKSNNQFSISHAWPGLCSLCFDEIAEYNGSNEFGKPNVTRYKSNRRVYEVELSDSSKMQINLCSDCYENICSDDHKELMISETKGWEHEIDKCIGDKWSKDKRDRVKDQYSKLSIGKTKKENKHGINIKA